MDAAQALADLTEISSQIVQAAVFRADGDVLASTFGDETRARRFVEGVARLVDAAEAVREAHGLPGLAQVEAATLDGSLFVVRGGNGGPAIAAVTRPDPTVGLVFYDLKHCLRSVDEKKPRARRKKADGAS